MIQASTLVNHQPYDGVEARHLERILAFVSAEKDPFTKARAFLHG